MNIKKHLDLLGRPVKDRVTGFNGVVDSVYFDLYGCVQAIVTPSMKDNVKKDSRCFDVQRLEVKGKPVMERPNWDFGPVAEGKHGPAEKPNYPNQTR